MSFGLFFRKVLLLFQVAALPLAVDAQIISFGGATYVRHYEECPREQFDLPKFLVEDEARAA